MNQPIAYMWIAFGPNLGTFGPKMVMHGPKNDLLSSVTSKLSWISAAQPLRADYSALRPPTTKCNTAF